MEENLIFKVSKAKDTRGNPIAFFDPRLPENAKTFEYKDVIKKNKANWSKSPRFKNVLPPHQNGFWFWYIGPTEDKWRNNFDRYIVPTIREIYQKEGLGESDLAKNLERTLDVIVDKIKTAKPDFDGDDAIDNETKEKIINKIEDFKNQMVNIKDDEEFKKAMKAIIQIQRLQGHEYSMANIFLIHIQNPNAKVVKSRSNWLTLYNRTVNEGAEQILLWKPSSRAKRPLSKQEKEETIDNFLKKERVSNINDLGPGQRERLNVKLSGVVINRSFDLYPVYDVSDTTLIEGKEDPIQDLLKKSEELRWFEEDKLSDEVKPIYNALLDFAKDKTIPIDFASAEKLGGSRGVSYSGRITLIHNKGNDVEITKTLAHELAHEILHQTYLKDKDPEIKDLFIGKSQGNAIIEQQAELTAWMVMAAFGFDVKTTSLNYVLLWGSDDSKMIKVFNTVSRTANYLIGEITKRGGKIDESILNEFKKYTPIDAARFAGVEDKFKEQMNENIGLLKENFKRFI